MCDCKLTKCEKVHRGTVFIFLQPFASIDINKFGLTEKKIYKSLMLPKQHFVKSGLLHHMGFPGGKKPTKTCK